MTGPPTPPVVTPVDGGSVDAGDQAVDGGGSAVDAGSATDAITGVTYEKNDDWDPVTSGIGDVGTFNPLFTVASDGSGTHTSLNQAIADANAIPKTECGRVYIRIKAGDVPREGGGRQEELGADAHPVQHRSRRRKDRHRERVWGRGGR